jgi:hypothetical protein
MDNVALMYPTVVVILLTFIVGFTLLAYRFSLVRNGQLKPGYFKLNRGGKPPARHEALEHNFSNLFEVPMLYYAAVAIAIATQHIDATLVTLAWLFVGLRIAHTLVHVLYNNVMHRLCVFFAGVITVGVIWVKLVSDIASVAGG